ncbi:hypothetical protein [Shimazuella alba]|uniref:Uncharacterized protein n=1 Tax=Shimazuella alba TaxID=2690964 RepID=A0A6I4VPY7_9BACL|nr:hypothetical protein [Shimazuella alba]MXQ53639.1 hypothetical protein [Shimazuella alba]
MERKFPLLCRVHVHEAAHSQSNYHFQQYQFEVDGTEYWSPWRWALGFFLLVSVLSPIVETNSYLIWLQSNK